MVTKISIVAALALLASGSALAQTRDARSTRDAYGARIINPNPYASGDNDRRVVRRLNNRVNARLDTRINRYRVGNSSDPTAAAQARPDDGTGNGIGSQPLQPEQQATSGVSPN